MWIYVPSGYCRSAAGSADSISASDWRFPLLAQYVTLSGKPTASASFWRAYRTKRWMTRLCGQMCAPSTASRGAARWISSLAATPASPSASPGSGGEPKTSGTSGRRSPGSLPRSAPLPASLRMSQATLPLDFGKCEASWKAWVIALRRDCLQRRKSARLTSESDCSSWPTPSGTVAQDGEGPATWLARRETLKEKGYNGNGAGMPLTIAAQMLTSFPPDPATGPGGSDSSPPTRRLNPRFVEMLMGWPTGWTGLEPVATAWSHWWPRMRSALCSLEARDRVVG